jgi:hypothetical protein
MLHWAIAIPFMVCYGTALLLFAVYNPDPDRLSGRSSRGLIAYRESASSFCRFLHA